MIFDKQLSTHKKSAGKNTKEYVIVHHTGSANYEAMCTLLSSAERQVSTHYVIGQKGEVCKIGTHNDILWHAGDSRYKNRTVFNRISIGIEICSDGHEYTDAQRKIVHELILYIIKQENIHRYNILRHADIAGYRGKWDVGPNFYEGEYGTWQKYQNSFREKTPEELIEEYEERIKSYTKLIKFLEKKVSKLRESL